MRKRYLLPIVLGLAAIAVLALLTLALAGVIRASGASCKVWPVSDEPYAQHLARQLGLDAEVFDYSMPAGVKLTAWLEVYVNGSLDESLSRYFYVSTSPDHKPRRQSGSFAFQRYYPNYSSESSAERCRWEFAHFGTGLVEWVNNPCKDIVSSGWSKDSARLGLGETKVIYVYFGLTDESSKKGNEGLFPLFLDEASIAEFVKRVDVCIFLKVRFDEAEGPDVLCNPVHGLPDSVKQE